MILKKQLLAGIACLTAFLFTACSPVYYGTLEKFGVEKRQILVDRVEDASNAQEKAKEQFTDALEQFRTFVDFDGGELEKTYNKLKSEFEASENRAKEVHDRVDGVKKVSEDLFAEWEEELKSYSNSQLRRQSQDQLNTTRRRYSQLELAMTQAVGKMDPVLDAFRDQVLFLKHNLNAQAVGSLKGTVDKLEIDVERLIQDMESSIAEANAFVESMKA